MSSYQNEPERQNENGDTTSAQQGEPRSPHPQSRRSVFKSGEGQYFYLRVERNAEVRAGNVLGHAYAKLKPWYVKSTIRGGHVAKFFHPKPGESIEEYLGKAICAEIEIWERTLHNDRKVMHIDYRPVTAQNATATLLILQPELVEAALKEQDRVLFSADLPSPLLGKMIVKRA